MKQLDRPGLLAAAFALLAGAAGAAPIATNTALPVGDGNAVVRGQLVFARAGAPGVDVRTRLFRTTMGYGVTPRLAVFASVPMLEREAAGSTVSGIGDSAVFARYELYRENGVGRTLRLAPFAGTILPTGREGETGDGSTDFFGGVVLTVATTRWGLDSQLRYDVNREAHGREAGDVLRAETSFQYRLAPTLTGAVDAGFLFAVLELSAVHAAQSEVGGVAVGNSGGTRLAVTPGLQWASSRLMFDLGVQLPVAERLKGTQVEPEYTVLGSVRINF